MKYILIFDQRITSFYFINLVQLSKLDEDRRYKVKPFYTNKRKY
jgi:hypothetical protein